MQILPSQSGMLHAPSAHRIVALAGVRYPDRLLPEVVTALEAAQVLAGKATAAPGQAANAEQATTAGQAAAMGASIARRTEPATPVHQPSLTKAFRWVLCSFQSLLNTCRWRWSAAGSQPVSGQACAEPLSQACA